MVPTSLCHAPVGVLGMISGWSGGIKRDKQTEHENIGSIAKHMVKTSINRDIIIYLYIYIFIIYLYNIYIYTHTILISFELNMVISPCNLSRSAPPRFSGSIWIIWMLRRETYLVGNIQDIWLNPQHTVGGRNPAPPWMVETLQIMGFCPPINWCRISSIHSILVEKNNISYLVKEIWLVRLLSTHSRRRAGVLGVSELQVKHGETM